MTDNKNFFLSPKINITEEDIEEIPGLKDLKVNIEITKKKFKKATGKQKYILKKQLIEMYQEQYLLKILFKKPILLTNINKSTYYLPIDENITVTKDKRVISNSIISFYNPQHIAILLNFYLDTKSSVLGQFHNDFWYIIADFENLLKRTFENKPIYYDIIQQKAQHITNQEIQKYIKDKYNTSISIEYLSQLWTHKFPRMIADKAEEDYLVWYYTHVEPGIWKICSKCGKKKLAHKKFFSVNKASTDGFYSICKECRNKKKGE